MSGFEVVGVVLGALPIIVSILESYKSLGRARVAFRNKQFYLDRMINALSWQKTLIEGDLEILLRNVGFEDLAIHKITSGSYEALLQDTDIQQQVRAYMGRRFESYVHVLSDCERTLLSIVRSVKGLQQGSWVDNGKLADMMKANQPLKHGDQSFFKRLRFSMRKDDLEEIIKELDRTSQILSRLRETSQEANQAIMQLPSVKTTKLISIFQQIQKRAYSLYGAIIKSWGKSCHDRHNARLYLDNRMDILETGLKGKRLGKPPAIEFTVTLEGTGLQGKSMCHTCSIETLSSKDSDGEDPGKVSVVSFTIPSAKLPPTKTIDDICRVIVESGRNNDTLKIYLRNDGILCYQHTTYVGPPSKITPSGNGKLVSLADILQNSGKRLSLKQRVRLSAVIAASTMQLYDTPWCAALRKECFMFLERDDSGLSSVDLDNPFVTCAFSSASLPVRKAGEAELLDLGILIVELWQSESIEEFAARKNVDLLDTYDCRQSVARRWLRETQDDMLPFVVGAARRCVECRFDALSVDWDDQKVNMGIFEAVVKPLWENSREQ